jgi:hypothetical protein
MVRLRVIGNNLVLLTGLAVAVCLGSLTARAEKFTVVGPGGGGAMFNATISPHDPREVLVSCDMSGAYISHDGGGSGLRLILR